jgi:hypothetical protein
MFLEPSSLERDFENPTNKSNGDKQPNKYKQQKQTKRRSKV